MLSFRHIILILASVSFLANCGGGGGASTGGSGNAPLDSDSDGVPNAEDAFPNDPAETQDSDSDGVGDNADNDDDNDGVDDAVDAFPLDAAESVDTDSDGVGNNADSDDDNDGVDDTVDAFPLDAAESVDVDSDGIGDNADSDDDNDGVDDALDAFPLNAAESVDTDNDGVGNNEDLDDDNDNVADTEDAFPLDASETVDADGDGVGDNSDAFPAQSACSIAVNAHSDGECYLTWLIQESPSLVASEEGLLYFYSELWDYLLVYNQPENLFSKVSEVVSQEAALSSVAYSPAHQRLYIGDTSGKISAYDYFTNTLSEFSTTTEAVEGLAAVGNFVLAQDDSGAWASHYIFSREGEQTDWEEWNYYSRVYAWNSALNRVYFFRDNTSPNDLHFEEINSFTGEITDEGETPYHGDYSMRPPIAVSANGDTVLLGSGDFYNAQTLQHEGSLSAEHEHALWLDSGDLLVVRNTENQSRLYRLSGENYRIVERVTYPGIVQNLSQTASSVLVVYRNDEQFFIEEYQPNNDSDNDGINNTEDAFPLDAAASVDSDGDGYPDAWHSGADGSNSSLIIDAFPNDSACYLPEHGSNGACNYAATMPDFVPAELMFDNKGTGYFLNESTLRVHRWDANSETYINPLLLDVAAMPPNTVPTRISHAAELQRLYVGFSNGVIQFFDLSAAQPKAQVFTKRAFNIRGLVAVGDHLFVAEGSSYRYDLHLMNQLGEIVNTVSSQYFSDEYEWNPELRTLFHQRTGISPNDIHSVSIDTNAWSFTHDESPYHGDFEIRAPFRSSYSANSVVTGAGHVFYADTLDWRASLSVELDDALWLGNGQLLTLTQQGKNFLLRRWSSDFELLETQSFTGDLLGIYAVGESPLIVTRHVGSFHFLRYQPSDDSDGDGVENREDAFPNDAAASLDSDRDGYPDAWNAGYSQSDSTSGLNLDAYPNDHACQTAEQGDGLNCNYAGAVSPGFVPNLIINDDQNIIYLFNSNRAVVYRWSAEVEDYIDSFSVKYPGADESVTATSLHYGAENKRLYVGYSNGEIRTFDALSLRASEVFARLPAAINTIVNSGRYLLVSTDSFDYGMNVFDTQGNLLDHSYRSNIEAGGVWSPRHERFYYRSYSRIESVVIEQTTGLIGGSYSYYSGWDIENFILSDDEDYLLLGHGEVVNADDLTSTPRQLEPFEFSAASFEVIALAKNNAQSSAAIKLLSPDLSPLAEFTVAEPLIDMRLLNSEIVYITQAAQGAHQGESGLRFNAISLGDTDSDTMPDWWENIFNLNPESDADATLDLDADGLNNLDEYLNGTQPDNSDTDGDSLPDGTEVNTHGTNPLSTDTDGDFLPDDWELANGLDPSESSDAHADSDADGVSNYHEFVMQTDPQDATSVPESISDIAYSFEDDQLPADWVLSGELETITYSEALPYHGNKSLYVSGEVVVNWSRLFAPVDLSFYTRTDCYNTYNTRLDIFQDGELLDEITPSQTGWQRHTISLSQGYHELQFVIESYDDSCGIFLDALALSPLQSVFQLGIEKIANTGRYLKFINIDGEVVKELAIPSSDFEEARDIAVLEDGRIAVYNGSYSPVLSLYSPETHLWQEIIAPAWSTLRGGSYGGIIALGKRVLATNMSTSGNQTAGIVEFDLTDNTVEYFSGQDLTDITLGLDGFVYGLDGQNIYRYDANDLSLQQSLNIGGSNAIAVDQSGDIYAASSDWNGKINHFSSEGVLIKALDDVDADTFYDLDLREDGALLAISWDNEAASTTTALADYQLSPLQANFLTWVPNFDTDNDGLPDWWEGANGQNIGINDADSDIDADGLSASEEYSLGTRANIADTDGDTLSDGDEVLLFISNPTKADSDDDGLTDSREVELGTQPLQADSDSDGLSDSEELNLFDTNPLVADMDGDGMVDGYEIEFGLDPKLDDASLDLDSDGLSNLEEHEVGSNPNIADTDGDSLLDGDEVLLHSTSPLLADSDSDRLPDAWEVDHGLPPNDNTTAALDSDLDQFSNLEEFFLASDPTDSTSVPQPVKWGTAQGNAAHTGYTPMILDETQFALRWEKTLANMPNLHPVVAGDGQVFVSNDAYFDYQGLRALSASNGEVQWALTFTDNQSLPSTNVHSVNPPAYSNGKVYFQTGGHEDSFLRSVSADDGSLNFASSYSNQWSTYLAPTIYKDGVYIAGGYYGGTYSFHRESGVQNWFQDGPQYDEFTPAVDNNHVYAFTTQLDVLDRLTGELDYSIAPPDIGWGGYSAGAATVLTPFQHVVATSNGSLVVFDLASKSVLWSKVDSGYNGQASSANGQIFAVANGNLIVLDEFTGNSVWAWAGDALNSNIIVTKTHAFVSSENTTYALDLNTRAMVWSYPAGGGLSLSDEGVLYIANSSLTAIALQ